MNSSNEHRSAFDNQYLSADGREDQYDYAEGKKTHVQEFVEHKKALRLRKTFLKSVINDPALSEQIVWNDGSFHPLSNDILGQWPANIQYKYNRWVRLKRLSAGSNNADGYSIMLNDNGDCI